MNIKKPVPMLKEATGRICPVCKKRSYSLSGVHPQCAESHADAPRTQKYLNEKKAKSVQTPASDRAARWKKRCPKCGMELHVRNKACRCGYQFALAKRT